jgi:hypothetical protein
MVGRGSGLVRDERRSEWSEPHPEASGDVPTSWMTDQGEGDDRIRMMLQSPTEDREPPPHAMLIVRVQCHVALP